MKRIASAVVVALLALPFAAHPADLGTFGEDLLEDYKYVLTAPTRLDVESGLITLGLVGVGVLLYTQDEQIQDFFQHRQSNFLDRVAVVAEKFGYWPADLGFIALYGGMGYVVENQKMQDTAVSSLESFAVANTISVAFKYGVGRARPKRDEGSSHYRPFSFDTSDTSFPSGHTTCAFSVASVFAEMYAPTQPWVPYLAYALASSTALERLYDEKHWATDVWAGAILGIVVGRSVVYLHKSKEKTISVTPVAGGTPGSLGLGIAIAF